MMSWTKKTPNVDLSCPCPNPSAKYQVVNFCPHCIANFSLHKLKGEEKFSKLRKIIDLSAADLAHCPQLDESLHVINLGIARN